MSEGGSSEQGLHRLVRFVGPSAVLMPLFTICISTIIARTLGPEGRGQYGVVVAAVAILPSVAGLGLEYAFRYWSSERRVPPGSLLRTGFLVAVVVGAVVASAVVIWWRLGGPAWLIPAELSPVGVAGLAVVLFTGAIRAFLSSHLLGVERYGYGIWGPVAGALLQALLLAAVAVWATVSLDAVVLTLTANALFSLLLFLPLAGRDALGALRARLLPLRELRAMFRYASWQYLSMIFIHTNMRLNVLLLAALSSFYETGLYTAVVGPAMFLQILASPLNTVLGPRTTLRQGDAGFSARVAGALRVLAVLVSLAAVVAAFAAPFVLIWLFGEAFASAVVPFWLLLPGVVAFGLFKVLIQYQSGAGHPEWNTWSSGSGAVVALVLNVALIPPYGAVGAAIATSLAYTTSTLVGIVGFMRVGRLRLSQLLVFRSSDWAPLWRVLGL